MPIVLACSVHPPLHQDTVRGDDAHLFPPHKGRGGRGEPGEIGRALADGHTLLIVTTLVMVSIHNELEKRLSLSLSLHFLYQF